MLIRKFNTKCWMSSKVWTMIMAFKNVALGISIIVGGSLWMKYNVVLDTFKTDFAFGVLLGALNIVAAIVLLMALVKGKENLVLLYLLLEFVNVFTLTIFSAMHILDPDTSIVFAIAVFCCLLFWVGLYNVYGFYLELQNYNNDSVQARIGDIACNTHPNPLDSFPEKALDTTKV